jgi:hypothetical protein
MKLEPGNARFVDFRRHHPIEFVTVCCTANVSAPRGYPSVYHKEERPRFRQLLALVTAARLSASNSFTTAGLKWIFI